MTLAGEHAGLLSVPGVRRGMACVAHAFLSDLECNIQTTLEAHHTLHFPNTPDFGGILESFHHAGRNKPPKRSACRIPD